jgi:glutaredoxin
VTAAVTVYSKTVCKVCDRVKLELKHAGITYETVNLDLPEHAEAKSYVENVIGARSVPVIVSDVLPPILGYQPDKLKQLATLLSEAESSGEPTSSD